jgi:hypothetical protein
MIVNSDGIHLTVAEQLHLTTCNDLIKILPESFVEALSILKN